MKSVSAIITWADEKEIEKQNKGKRENMPTIKIDTIAINIHHIRIWDS